MADASGLLLPSQSVGVPKAPEGLSVSRSVTQRSLSDLAPLRCSGGQTKTSSSLVRATDQAETMAFIVCEFFNVPTLHGQLLLCGLTTVETCQTHGL